MPYGLPAATTVKVAGRAEMFSPKTGKIYGPEWLHLNRNLTILHAASDQDGFDGEIICLHPAYGDGRCLAVPRGMLWL